MRVNTHSDRPLVSAIIPAFNAAAVIERTLGSVIEQTYPAMEILVIDDGSTDETSSVVKTLAIDDSRIRLLQQENKGVSAARNLGIKHARGEYIAPLDAGDTWLPEKIEKQVEVFRSSPATTGLVYTQSVRVFEGGKPSVYPKGGQEEGPVLFLLLLGNFLQNGSTPLIRRHCFDHVGMFSLEYMQTKSQGCEDWDIYLRIAEHYEFRMVDEYLTGYWQSVDSMSADWNLMDRSYQLLMGGVRRRLPEIPEYVFRWSESNYGLYLARRAAQVGQAASSMKLLVRAVSSDPFMFLNRRLQRLVAKNLLYLVRGRKSITPVTTSQKPMESKSKRDVQSSTIKGIWGRRMKQRKKHLIKLQKELGFDRMSGVVVSEASRAGEN